ncbi:MAG: dockerin type I domain-containing protein, partial [Bacillota bacterium]
MKKKSLLKKDNLFIRGLYCLVVFFLIITASTIIPEEIQAAGLLGDLNEDQSIDSIDFSLLSRYISGITDDMSMESSDLNSDGYIDSLDIALLRRYLTGSIAVFPGEENEDNTESEKPWYPGNGTRQMENIDRGLVAVQVDDGVFISWRMFGTDPESIAF